MSIEVKMIRYTATPLEAIEYAASTCYDSSGAGNGKIMEHCYKSGHLSVLEFAHFFFQITGISRACMAQLTRHRTGHYAVRSQRYCDESNTAFVYPSSIQNNPDACSLYHKTLDNIMECYTALQKLDIPKEDARFILPNACETTICVDFDFHNLCHFMNVRLCKRAQWEVREVAQKMKALVCNVFPEAKNKLVPTCLTREIPYCTEGTPCKEMNMPSLKELVHGKVTNKKDAIQNTIATESYEPLKICADWVAENEFAENERGLILIVGESGGGKTTLAQLLEERGLHSIQSYTTRPPRYPNETGHTFVTDEEFDKLTDLAAYTKYCGYRYAATAQQVEDNQVYVLNPEGIKYFNKNYHGNKTPIIVYVTASEKTREKRMLSRGDDANSVLTRLWNDGEAFEEIKKHSLYDIIVYNDYDREDFN